MRARNRPPTSFRCRVVLSGRDVRRHDLAKRGLQREAAGKRLAARARCGEASTVAGDDERPAAGDIDIIVRPGRGATAGDQWQQQDQMTKPHRDPAHRDTSAPGDFRYLKIASRLRIGQRTDRAGRVVAGVLRKRRGPHHEHVRDVPGLQIAVEHAGVRVRPHHRAASIVRGLVGHHRPWHPEAVDRRALGAHRLGDLLAALSHPVRHLLLVRLIVERHAHQGRLSGSL